MTINSFIFLLSFFTVLNGLVTEAFKKIISSAKLPSEEKLPYNLFAVIFGLIIGGIGTYLYFMLNNLPYNIQIITMSILMGFATSLSSMVGYDKVKQLIKQLDEVETGNDDTK